MPGVWIRIIPGGYPAWAGIDLMVGRRRERRRRLPRVGGDRPSPADLTGFGLAVTPRGRG